MRYFFGSFLIFSSLGKCSRRSAGIYSSQVLGWKFQCGTRFIKWYWCWAWRKIAFQSRNSSPDKTRCCWKVRGHCSAARKLWLHHQGSVYFFSFFIKKNPGNTRYRAYHRYCLENLRRQAGRALLRRFGESYDFWNLQSSCIIRHRCSWKAAKCSRCSWSNDR